MQDDNPWLDVQRRPTRPSSAARSRVPTGPTTTTTPPAAAGAPMPTGRGFYCGRCPESFPTPELLNAHRSERNHYRCNSRGCARDFDSRTDLLIHRSVCEFRTTPPTSSFAAPSTFGSAPGPRAYFCRFDGCNRAFPGLDELNEHLSSQRHYCCMTCKQRFDTRTWSAQHVCPGPPPAAATTPLPGTSSASAAAASTGASPWPRRSSFTPPSPAWGSTLSSFSAMASKPPPSRTPGPFPPTASTTSKSGSSSSPTGADPGGDALDDALADIACRRERVRQLAQRPHAYDPAGKKRFVFMDTDNIFFSMVNSPHLHRLVPGGVTSSRELRLNFDTFTKRVCASPDGCRSPLVRLLRATYFGAADVLAEGLARCGWSVDKQETVSDTYLKEQIQSRRNRNDIDCSHTLVLVTGDGNTGNGGAHTSSFRGIVDQFLQLNWCVEIHAWAHSIHDGYIRYMQEYPQHVAVRLLDDTDDAVRDLVFATTASSARGSPHGPAGTGDNAIGAVADAHPRDELARELAAAHDENAALRGRLTDADARLARADDETKKLSRRLAELEAGERVREDRALIARHQAFEERRDALTCRLSKNRLFHEPLLLTCCHRTASKAAVADLAACPYCHTEGFGTLPNRAIEDIVRVFLRQAPH